MIDANTLVNAMLDNVYFVRVQFENGGRLYTYRSSFKPNIDDDVLVVVNNTTKVVKVREVFDYDPDNKATQWLVQAVDYSQWFELNALTDKARKQAQEISAKLARKRAMEAIKETLGFSDDEFAKLKQDINQKALTHENDLSE